MMESEQLWQAREEVASTLAKTTQLLLLAQESVKKAEEAQTTLFQFQQNMMIFKRDMAFMRSGMQANDVFPNDLETQGRFTFHFFC